MKQHPSHPVRVLLQFCLLALVAGGGCFDRPASSDAGEAPKPKRPGGGWEARVREEFLGAMRERVTMKGSTWEFTKTRLPNLFWQGGVFRSEVRNVQVSLVAEPLDEADRLNGIQWRGELRLSGKPCRERHVANQEYLTELIGPLAGMMTDRRLIPTNRVEVAGAAWSDWAATDYFQTGVTEFVLRAVVRNDAFIWERFGDPGVMWLVPQGKPTDDLGSLLVDFER